MPVKTGQITEQRSECPKYGCVYAGPVYATRLEIVGVCSNPRVNAGNSDASCFKMSAKDIMHMISIGVNR